MDPWHSQDNAPAREAGNQEFESPRVRQRARNIADMCHASDVEQAGSTPAALTKKAK